MKILLSQKIAVLSGSEWYLLNLIPGLKEKGHEVHFMALVDTRSITKAEELIDMFLERGIKVHKIMVDSDLSFSLYKKIYEILKTENYNFIHSNLIRTDFIFSMVKLLFMRNLYIISSHHGFDNQYQEAYGFNYIPQPLNKFILISKFNQRFIDYNITISHGIKQLMTIHKILKKSNIKVIHYGFAFKDVLYDNNHEKYRFSKYQLLIVGRLVGFKGHKYVFEIMPDLINKYGKDISLVIVGHGKLEDQLKKEVQERDISAYVHFIGFSTQVHDYMKNSDVLLIPSKSEGFCVVIMEAFHTGIPIAAFDVPAVNESVIHDSTGLLAKPYDVIQLKENIENFLDNDDVAQRITRQSFEYLNSYLTVERMVNETNELYTKIVKDNKL